MSFGRNPHVAKADDAELKAENAADDIAYEQAWREAAKQGERAASREKDAKRCALYRGNAETARSRADEPREPDESAPNESATDDTLEPSTEPSATAGTGDAPKKPIDPGLLN